MEKTSKICLTIYEAFPSQMTLNHEDFPPVSPLFKKKKRKKIEDNAAYRTQNETRNSINSSSLGYTIDAPSTSIDNPIYGLYI